MALVSSILFPTDFSTPAAKALDYAVGLARDFGARIVLLHVVQPTAYPLRNLASVSGFPNLHDEIRKGVTRELDALRKTIAERIEVEVEMREGVPHDQILAAAEQHGCDLIVLATHGHTGLKHVLLGSTAERVVRLSKRPVLTLRAGDGD